jgi:glycosyltransferase involved in cell wall biosynthesis
MKKKVLLLNTKYRKFGGEDSNITQEKAFLEQNYIVDYLEFNNSNKLKLFDLIYLIRNNNRESNMLLLKKIKSFNPDVVYVHNLWFKANLGILEELNKYKIKTILKIHNFRYSCTQSYSSKKHLNGLEYCFKCNYKNKKRILNKYFQESYMKSFLVINHSKKYLSYLKNLDIAIVVMTEFQKSKLIESGISQDKISLYENPINDIEKIEVTYNPDSNYVVYAGQVSDSKGVENLIKAWEMTNNTDLLLKIIGSGDKLEILRSKYIKPNIQFLGEKSNRESLEIIRNARAVVSATKMFEGQPRLLCEASSMGVPSIFPNFGGMSEFFPRDYQLMFHQYDYKDLTLKLKMLNDTILLNSLSLSIKKNIDEKLSSSKLIEKFERLHFSE